MTFLHALLAAIVAAAVLTGIRRSRYDGTPPRTWWAQERQYRTRSGIATRALRVLSAVALLVASTSVAITALAITVASVGVIAVLTGVWFWLRQAATATEPPVTPVERLATGDLTPADLDRTEPPRPPPTRRPLDSTDDPDHHASLEI